MVELQAVWGWQPALYLFLGGMGAGAFIMASIASFVAGDEARRAVSATMWASVVCLGVGLLLLVSELVFPLRGMMLWQSFSHFTSWMTFGAWAVFAAVIVFGICAVVSTESISKWLDPKWGAYEKLRGALWKPLSVVGIVLGVCVAVYTGVLLMSVPGTPLWNTLLLPCLFTVSALDTGVALYEIISAALAKREPMPEKVHGLASMFVTCLVVAELAVLGCMMATLGSGAGVVGSAAAVGAASVATLVSGQLAPEFWVLVVVIGLLVPLIASVAGRRATGKAVMACGATGALIGGCALRFLILAAGVHADPIAASVITLLS